MDTKPVIYVQDADYSSAESAVSNVFKKFPLEVKNKLVWVKPNMLGDFAPSRHATTHPSIASAIVNKLLSLGAKVVVGDNSGVQDILAESVVARKTGIMDASHGTFRNISREVSLKTIGNGFDERVSISKIADECDIMITVPKMKTHLQTFITGAVKNSYGLVVGVQKPKLHLKYPQRDKFCALAGEIFNLRKPDLVIMDGVYAMEGDGPNSPDIRRVNKIIASRDAVALDHYISKVMGMDPVKVPLLAYCASRGYGSNEWQLHSDSDWRMDSFKLPKTYNDVRLKDNLILRAIYKFVTDKRIIINNNICTRCAKCYKVCPVGAIRWDKKPVIDSSKCILCYCCKEMCEYDAIRFAKRYVCAQKALNVLNKFKYRTP